MVMLEITQKTIKTSMKIMAIGVRSKEVERILEFCAAMNMTVRNTLFQKWASYLIFYESGPSKTQLDYCLIRRS